MAWVAAVAILFFLIYSSGFRKVALGVVAVLVATGLLWYLYEEIEDQRSRSRIKPAELELEDFRFSHSTRTLTGRIKNNSKTHTLRSIGLKIFLHDCTDKAHKVCTTVGEAPNTLSLDVPPNQARDFSDSIYGLKSPNPRGEIVWSYEITYIKGND